MTRRGRRRSGCSQVAGALQTLVEVTGVHEAHEQLRASEERFRALVTAGTFSTCRMNADWRERHQLVGRDFLADTPEPTRNWADGYLLDEDRPAIFVRIDEAIRTRFLFEMEHRVRRADGGVGWVHSRANPSWARPETSSSGSVPAPT